MSTVVTVAILTAAGVLLVIQNLLMVRITTSVSTVLVTLVLNSGVGLILLVALLSAKAGIGAVAEALHSFWRRTVSGLETRHFAWSPRRFSEPYCC
jgi:transporter family-2 protein